MKERFKLIPAVYLLLRQNDEILLLQRANTGYQDGKYSLVAGHLDGDETAVAGIIREAKEEAGIVIIKESLNFVHVAHRLSRSEPGQERIDLFFECRTWENEVTNMEPAKCQDLGWFPINAIPDETIPLIKLVIADIVAGKSYSEYTFEPA